METFELRRTRDGQYFFTFRASSGQAIAESIPYATRRAAVRAMGYLREHAGAAAVRDRTGEAANGGGSGT